MRAGQAVNKLFTVAYSHRIQIPTDLTILGKNLLTVEGIVEKLDPELSIIKVAEPFGRQMVKDRFNPKNVGEKVWNHLFEYSEIMNELPKTVKDFTSIMKKGKMRIEVSTPELEVFLKRFNRISNRFSFSIVLLSFSIIMVGVIIGAALSGQTSVLLSKVPLIDIGFGLGTAMSLVYYFQFLNQGDFEHSFRLTFSQYQL